MVRIGISPRIKNGKQAAENIQASGWQFSEEDYAAIDGDGATGLAGARAAHGDGDACFGAELHDGGGLFGACDLGYGVGSTGNARALVMAVVCAYCVGGEKPALIAQMTLV